MAISLYSGFVPVCLQLLGGLKTVLQKAEEHATAQKWDTATVLNLRLYPDMFTLERQVRQVCNHALAPVASPVSLCQACRTRTTAGPRCNRASTRRSIS